MAQAAVPLVPPPQLQNPIPPRRDGAQHRLAQQVRPARAVLVSERDGAEYQKLKDLDAALDSAHDSLSHAQQLYQETLKAFAILCHELWAREKAQGNRQGKGFRLKLQTLGVKVGRAYRAMKKFFPADFPAKRKSLTKQKIATSFAANEVRSAAAPMSGLYQRLGTRSRVPGLTGVPGVPSSRAGVETDDLPTIRFTGKLSQGKEALECTFALTPEEKAEITESLKLLDAAQLQQLFLQALKQAAKPPVTYHESKFAAPKSEIANVYAVCYGVTLDDAPAVSATADSQRPEIEHQPPKELLALRPSRNAVNEGVSASSDALASRGPLGRRGRSELSRQLEAQKSEIANKDAVCNGVSLESAPAVPAAAKTLKSAIQNQKSEIPFSLEAGAAALRSWGNAVHERASATGNPLASQGPQTQKSEIANNHALCNGVTLDGAPAVSAAADNQKSKIRNLKSATMTR